MKPTEQATAREKEDAILALRDNCYHDFSERDARGIVLALYLKGFRIIRRKD